MTTETSNARGEWVSLLERAAPFLHDEGAKYDDDGSNEPLELAREIETLLASLPSDESALSPANSAFDGGRGAAPCPHTSDTNCDCADPPPAAARGDVRGLAVPPQAEPVTDPSFSGGVMRKGDWAIPSGQGCVRVMDERMAYGWNQCREEMLQALAAEGVQAGEVEREVAIGEAITVADLASKLALKGGDVVKALLRMGVMATITQSIDHDTAALVVEELGHKAVAADDGVMPQPEARGVVDVCPKCGAPAEVTEHAGAFEITEEYRYIGMSDAEVVAVPRWFMEKLGRDLADIEMPAMSKSIAALTGERNG